MLVPMHMVSFINILHTRTSQKKKGFLLGPHLPHQFPAFTVESLAQTLCGCTSYSWPSSTKIVMQSKRHNRNNSLSFFSVRMLACLLLAACYWCLLLLLPAARMGSSTLDLKEGYETLLATPAR